MITEYKLETDKKIEFQDEFGMHVFKTEEEYEKYIYERNSKLPNVCETCIYGCQTNKKKYSCPFDGPHGKDNPCRACSNYWRNPSGLKDWLKWHKHKFLNKYYSLVDKIQRKFKIGFFKTYRKAFWFWPTFKHPYFEFVKRLRNEYEDECNVYRLGWISKKNSYYKSSSFFERFHTIGYVFCREHVNYQQAKCINDCYINTFNNIENGDSYFICHKGELYHVRHVAKYKYYDVLYNVHDEDEYNLRLKGQISEEEFNKYFKIPNHEELMLKLEEINRKKRQTQTNKSKETIDFNSLLEENKRLKQKISTAKTFLTLWDGGKDYSEEALYEAIDNARSVLVADEPLETLNCVLKMFKDWKGN